MENEARYTCRLFVGGIPPGVKTSDVKEIFDKYGEILDIFVKGHFAFVQFNDKESAEAALIGENGKSYFGSRFVIQFARKPKSEFQEGSGGPMKQETQNRRWTPYEKKEDFGPPKGFGVSAQGSNDMFSSGPSPSFDHYSGRELFEGGAYGSSGGPSNRGRFESEFERQTTSAFPLQPPPTYAQQGGYRGGYIDPPRTSDPISHAERTNDIEIICQKPLRSYGEYIEAELKKSHFLVDVLFPEGGVPIDELLDNISSRGTLYAIVINNYHQQTNRLDLHVLHGVRKVLENTPLKAAVEYLVSNYAEFNAKRVRKPRNILPEQVMLLLRRLVESQCYLSYTEYEILANYFTQQKVKLEPSIVPPPAPKVVQPPTKETELADRILSILNKKISSSVTPSCLPGNLGVNDLLLGIARSNPP